MTRKSWVYVNGKAYEKGTEPQLGGEKAKYQIIPDIEPFKSPITGEVIRGRGHLRQHMKEHGVTNIGDYSQEYFDRKQVERSLEMRGQTKKARAERIELIKQAMER